MKTIFVNGKILDGSRDMRPMEGLALVCEGKSITAIVPEAEAPVDGRRIDLQGQYLLPGLINLHVHLAGSGKPSKKKLNLELICKLITSNALGRKIGCRMLEANTTNALMAGVTTVRAVGGIGNLDSRLRNQINSGKIPGPHILTSDSAIAPVGGHMAGSFATAVSNADEAVALVDRIAKDKPDLIKLMITGGVLDCDSLGEPGVLKMSPDIIQAVCKRAHELGYPVAAHCEGTEGVKEALLGGVDTIEHGAKPTEEILTLFREKKASQVLTISPALPYKLKLPGVMNLTDIAARNSSIVVDGMVELAKANLRAGVPVGLGTDASCSYVTHYGFWRELQHFVNYCGVTPAFALHTATLVNARIAGIDDKTGSLEVGKTADMIVVRENPLENLEVLREVTMVVIDGQVIDKPVVMKYPEVEEVLDHMMGC